MEPHKPDTEIMNTVRVLGAFVCDLPTPQSAQCCCHSAAHKSVNPHEMWHSGHFQFSFLGDCPLGEFLVIPFRRLDYRSFDPDE